MPNANTGIRLVQRYSHQGNCGGLKSEEQEPGAFTF